MERILELFDECVRGNKVVPELNLALQAVKMKKKEDIKNLQQYIGFSGSNLVIEWSEAILVADLKLIKDMTKLIEGFSK